MSSSAAPWWLLTAVVALSGGVCDAITQSHGRGRHRAGQQLTGLSPLRQLQTGTLLSCLRHCDRESCAALNYGAVGNDSDCQLFGETACDGYTLVAAPAVSYFDVADHTPVSARDRHFTEDAACADTGYCTPACRAAELGEFCAGPIHCTNVTRPTDSVLCAANQTCQLDEANFWLVQPALALPKQLNWEVSTNEWQFKKLGGNKCALDVSVKIDATTTLQLSANYLPAHDNVRLIFKISVSTTELFQLTTDNLIVPFGTFDTTGMVTENVYSRLKISWCSGLMEIGPTGNPSLVSAQASTPYELAYLMAYSSPARSWLRVISGYVADAWLFEEQGVGPDPVMTVPEFSFIGMHVTPTTDFTFKFDCMATADCNVVFDHPDSVERIVVCIGCVNNLLTVVEYWSKSTNIKTMESTGAAGIYLSTSAYNTFTVHYNAGTISVLYNTDPLPYYTQALARPLPAVSWVGVGASCCGIKYVRVARYDPRWRTDTWAITGTGFMADTITVY